MSHLPELRGNLKPILCAQGWQKTLTISSNQIQGENCKITEKRSLMRTTQNHHKANKAPDPLEQE